MKDTERRAAARNFVEYWKDRGDEKGESQSFWLSLLRDVLGVDNPEKTIIFEERVKLDHTSFIDGHIPYTHVLIEQKKRGLNLRAAIKQSDGSLLTPFQQAQRYSAALPYSQRPRWIITCNFEEFLIYDMEKPTGEPESILLSELPKEYYRLEFLVEEKSELLHREEQISIKAGELVGKLYDAILKQYINPDDEKTLRSLNMLCVRLVFCLYAEDAGIFGGHNKFHNYIQSFNIKDVRRALIDLFKVLDTKTEERDPYMDDALAAFPYVNGGLFADEDIEIPNFTQEIVDLLLHNASEDFDWSQISPTIFGAVFESTLNPETRRSGGMHYTSIENIHKVIDPLFLDELHEELDEIKALKQEKAITNRINAFREKLGNLTFFDPACGSGNFLTQTYIELRRLENEALEIMQKGGQIEFDFGDIIKVSIGQFYGIEINDFAVTVAKTALWIAESQMLKETEDILQIDLDFLPLKSYANIVEGNALRIDWETVVPKDKLNYIMGNPPFVGAKLCDANQRKDKESILGKEGGKLDYVACWYKKAADFCLMLPNVGVAFVSTNSIAQGEQVPLLWKSIFALGYTINFAHTTFKWSSQSNEEAAVHCVIVGYSKTEKKQKLIYYKDRVNVVSNINAYLINASNVFLEKRRKPLCNTIPDMTKGSQLIDGGNFIINSESEKEEFIKCYPESKPYIFEYCNADSFLNNRPKKYCLFLEHCPPNIIKNCKGIYERVEKVYQYRKNSDAELTRSLQDRPTRYFIANIPKGNSVLVPVVSSERRKYIPLGYLTNGVVYTNATNYIDDASLFHFGVLISNVHMAWMRSLCGRLKSDYRYSKDIVYNNFPWPNPTEEQKAKIEQTAQAILDARALYPDCSLADLYDEVAMPPELRKAHQANDKAVMQAYGFWGKLNSESECVAELMKMYQDLVE
ncbi:MAG: class I SAM-dependent DNA methyltransferase [Clostridia bacterium]|nr:class I SAM-dependent DNA methyltransferase [Clostridia bacterium]